MFYRKATDVEAAKIFLGERINNRESIIFVSLSAERQDDKNEMLAGFVQLYPIFSSTRMKRLWLLNDLFVSVEHRGKGISKLLIERCGQLANETNAGGVMLETEKTNEIGNCLYLQTGFKLIENNFYFL
ncbi:MAG: GNAT family N-acetyltransferase [Chitinophagales bacterium]|nr:GNAT family N-acetyltransferase [Chitinophagales bacterium]